MSKFSYYSAESKKASYFRRSDPFPHDKTSSATQTPTTIEQIDEFCNKTPVIQEFLTQYIFTPEKHSDLYHALQKTIRNYLNPINFNSVKSVNSDNSGFASNLIGNRPFHQKALSFLAAVMLGFIGPTVLKDRSASAVAKSISSVTATDSRLAPVVAEENAAQAIPKSVSTISFADFKFSKVNPGW